MRRKEREITDIDNKMAIIDKCKVCRLGLSDDNQPYIVPLNYGYCLDADVLTLFFHGAQKGKKVDIIKKNNMACFEVDCDSQFIEGATPCTSAYLYKSVTGRGKIIIMETAEDKINGLNKIMKHQTGKYPEYRFTEADLKNVMVYKMEVEEFTGKQKEFTEK
ncbi:MAG: pyridoxamine 5'-phosphate oxidase family protein [Prevotellaceae bacterium]|jgi:nitroimidazol reductase NimA-like FMN-containing flavoprotein (pyridoxamine 5'-phosphate oxidase superfamily)|nr:pyridoxamine 5'-phosphate oxidase family protein [Prevotellaceae bacterium]